MMAHSRHEQNYLDMEGAKIFKFFIVAILFVLISCNNSNDKNCVSNAITITENSLKKTQLDENSTLKAIIINSEKAIREIERIDISNCESEFQIKFTKFLNLLKESHAILKEEESKPTKQIDESELLTKYEEPESLKRFERLGKKVSRLWEEIKLMDNQ